jgi:hypothetical protein
MGLAVSDHRLRHGRQQRLKLALKVEQFGVVVFAGNGWTGPGHDGSGTSDCAG